MRATWRPLPAWPYPARPKKADLFKSSWGATLQKLEAEISAVKGSELIIGVVTDEAAIRIDGQLRADAKMRHPGAEVSFEVDGRRLVFHTDAYNVLQSNLRAIALGLESLRAVDRYGITSSAEQYAGFAQLTAGEPIEERGRKLVEAAGSVTEALKRHHPDHGGDEADFVAVQAYRNVRKAVAV